MDSKTMRSMWGSGAKWQEGDAASSYADWQGEWEHDFSETDELEMLDLPDMDHAGELESVPQEVSL